MLTLKFQSSSTSKSTHKVQKYGMSTTNLIYLVSIKANLREVVVRFGQKYSLYKTRAVHMHVQ